MPPLAQTPALSTATNLLQPPATLLTLPLELRLKIYEITLTTSTIHSFRPQRKIGWNRPHAHLSNPSLLFESDSHPVLRALFHSKLTKGDHAVVLGCVLRSIRVLIADHTDFSALIKVCELVGSSSSNRGVAGRPESARGPAGAGTLTGPKAQASAFAGIVKENLRTLDFNDNLDEIVCQPNDIVKLLRGLCGVKTIHLASKHVQRYSGTIQDHVEFAMERAERETNLQNASSTPTSALYPYHSTSSTTISDTDPPSESRRIRLRSPMTDGNRMMISPNIYSHADVSQFPRSLNSNSNSQQKPKWVTVDLSMLIWQHFLSPGAPYKDHWRLAKTRTLLDVAEKRGVNIVLGMRNIEFDPGLPRDLGVSGSGRRSRTGNACAGGVFKGEMSTHDWVLRLKGRGEDEEYTVRQRRVFDGVVGQEGCGLVRCRHRHRDRQGKGGVCGDCEQGKER